jgi:hypothetical protein
MRGKFYSGSLGLTQPRHEDSGDDRPESTGIPTDRRPGFAAATQTRGQESQSLSTQISKVGYGTGALWRPMLIISTGL